VLHNGSDRGGVSVHWIDEGIDTGAILERRSFPIAQNATQETGRDNYYPMPGDREFASYFEQRRFFRIRDVLGLIAFRGLRR
jgi:hypothetical protein